MDFLNNVDVASMGFLALATFGSVSAVNFWKKLDTKQNFLLSVAFAFAFTFVPENLGNVFLNKFRDAYAIATFLNGLYQFSGGVVKKIGAVEIKK